MADIEQPSEGTHHPADPGESERLPYHQPVLRSHGGLRDISSQMSGQVTCVAASDVAAKQNIFAVTWA